MKINTLNITWLKSAWDIFIYDIQWYKLLVQDYYIWIKDIKISRWIFWINLSNKIFNYKDPLEKQLSRIKWFYEVLNKVEETDSIHSKMKLWKLMDVVEYDKEESIKQCKEYAERVNNEDTLDFLLWCWYIWECTNIIRYDCVDDIVNYVYIDEMWEWEKIRWILRKEEFNLLMQIYYGVYEEEKLRKELEEKEKKWEYEELRDRIKRWRIYEEWEMYNKVVKEYKKLEEEYWENKLKEYLKLELMRKNTEWAFKIRLEDYKDIIEELKKKEEIEEEKYKEYLEKMRNKLESIKYYNEKINKVLESKEKRKKALILKLLLDIRKEFNIKVKDETREKLKDIIDWLIWKDELKIELRDRYLEDKAKEARKILEKEMLKQEEGKIRIEKRIENIRRWLEDNTKRYLEKNIEQLKIKKIYDVNWDEEEQRKVVEKINKELGKEVVILKE